MSSIKRRVCRWGFGAVISLGTIFLFGGTALAKEQLPVGTGHFSQLQAEYGTLTPNPLDQAAVEKCNSGGIQADTMCLEGTSPKIVGAVSVINGLMSGASVLGLNEACSKHKQVMDVATAAMTAFTAQCAYFKYSCESSCVSGKAQVEKNRLKLIKEKEHCLETSGLTVEGCGFDPQIANATKASAYLSKMIVNCNSYSTAITSSIVGAAALAKRYMVANQCETKTGTDCTANPNAAGCVVKLDCSKSENDTKVECICMKAPRTAGCPGASAPTTASVMGSSPGNSAAPAATPAPPTDPNFSLTQDLNGSKISGGPGSGGAGVGSPGAGGSGGGGRGADSAKSAAANGKSSLNANILSGDQGGGGGGGMRYGSGRSGQDSSAQYKAYLPGGEKDPGRNLASQPAQSEVTGAGGEDNWNKVSSRYRDNKPTLMGE